MSKPLIIAEKPDMGKKIAAALNKPHKNGDGFIETADAYVSWAIGHVMESFKPEDYNPQWAKWSLDNLPMIVDEWKIKVNPDKAKQFKIIKNLVGQADISFIVNAGDPGREGQLIVDEILFYLKNKKPVKRILLPSLDKASILNAYANMEDNTKYFHLYEAAVCRGFADWHMGINATCAYTLVAQKSGYKGVLSVGRVQSPTLAIVVRRDEIIENFVPQDYFVIIGQFEHQNTLFNAYWKPQNTTPASWLDEESRLKDKMVAQSIASKVKQKLGVVIEYTEEEHKEPPPLPFNLSKMQIYANAKWGMTAKETLDTCQSLYEKHELQTYPRTDCQYLPEIQISDASIILSHVSKSHPQLANAVSGANTQLKSKAWNDKEIGEHFGLIPTKKQADLSQLSDKERKVYQAVCERYIAQFYPVCEYKTAVVVIDCEKEHFKSTGKVITKAGWRQIFNNDEEQEDKKDGADEEQVFPAMKQGENVHCKDAKTLEKRTTPPPRFNEGTLIKAMTNVHTLVSDPIQKQKLREKKGIGQEATRTTILETLFKRQLFNRQGKQIISSPAGRALIHALPSKVTDPALTAIWEDALDKIAAGQITADNFRQKQIQWVTQLITEAKSTQINNIPQTVVALKNKTSTTKASSNSSSNTSVPKAATKSKGKICPKCKTGHIIEKTAKASGKKFSGCDTWPKCDYVEWPKK